MERKYAISWRRKSDRHWLDRTVTDSPADWFRFSPDREWVMGRIEALEPGGTDMVEVDQELADIEHPMVQYVPVQYFIERLT